jgi:hypothetical protein
LLLRWLLPAPVAAEGHKFVVGNEVRCHYIDGYLLKRVTQIIDCQGYAFEVVEQSLALRGIRLLGGEYQLRDVPVGRTRVALLTYYQSPNYPRWLCEPIEAAVCHLFHRHILAAIQNNLKANVALVDGP